MFTVLAFRYGGKDNTFPIGVFKSRQAAELATKEHRIYEFNVDEWDDDIGNGHLHYVSEGCTITLLSNVIK